MDYTIEIKNSALKAIEKSQPDLRKRLWKAIWLLKTTPRPQGASRLVNVPGLWKLRVGGYRIVYKIIEDRVVVVIVAVGPRGDVYKHLPR